MSTGEYTFIYDSPVGPLTLASDGTHITGLWRAGQKHYASTLSRDAREKSLPVFEEAAQWLDAYFLGKDPGPRPPLKPIGSPFRQAVWQDLLNIPYGETTTYGDITKRLSNTLNTPTSPRAVGGAVARNPISILIPCHRVLSRGGGLSGYAGGVDTKIRLLTLEGALS
ncbi:MAG: methylated-DNA--[protein]-cysteine S-methyltransferase [Eubacteriales bacterium]|nr:methylated-DNA--[protein]-cysteine S-methyltransferase [Eubacteriales bacterium]